MKDTDKSTNCRKLNRVSWRVSILVNENIPHIIVTLKTKLQAVTVKSQLIKL